MTYITYAMSQKWGGFSLQRQWVEQDMQLPLSECNLGVMGGANPNLTLLDHVTHGVQRTGV